MKCILKGSYLLTLLLIFTCCSALYAENNPPPNCIELGTNPSFIIKLKNYPSDLLRNTQLDPALLQVFSQATHLTFIKSRAMSQGAYIVFFQADNAAQRCYPEPEINFVIAALQSNPEVEYAAPNRLFHHNMLSSEATLNSNYNANISDKQWYLKSNADGKIGNINAIGAWQTNSGNPNAVVAVLDGGILNNNSLAPNIVGGVHFVNSGDAGTGAAAILPNCGVDNAHGTHVAGIIASTGNGAYNESVYGVAPSSTVIPINVFTADSEDCETSWEADQLNAINWLAGTATFASLPAPPQVVAVNMSLGGGGGCDSAQIAAFTNLKNKNIAVVISAGNGASDTSGSNPANCARISTLATTLIPVAATGPTGQLAWYSDWGSIVAIAAPGGDNRVSTPTSYNQIYSTVQGDNASPANSYLFLKGTSQAAPIVAGVLSLLYAVDPTLTPTRALSIMQSTVNSGSSCGAPHTCGAGIVNANNALAAVKAAAPTLQWTPNFHLVLNDAASATLSWQAAQWSNGNSTQRIYSVTLDGVAVTGCQAMTATRCDFNNLSADNNNGEHSYSVSTTDYRAILLPLRNNGTFVTHLVAPTLTFAVRNVNIPTQVWLYYSDLGTDDPNNTYTVNGLTDETFSIDRANKRFILGNIPADSTMDITITVSNTNVASSTSNSVNIPSISLQAPTLSSATRNPLLSSQAWVQYSNLGTGADADLYTVTGYPSFTVTLDLVNQRFVLDNIDTIAAFPITLSVLDPNLGKATSNQITIPNAAFMPPTLTTAQRNSVLHSEAFISYSNLGTDIADDTYTIDGVSGATVTLDRTNSRFVITNINDDAQIAITISVHNPIYGNATSNSINIPNADLVAPTLTGAQRNPSLLNQAWITYSNIGTDTAGTTYTVNGLSEAIVSIDRANNRFVIDNVNHDAAIPITITLHNPTLGDITSNAETIPNASVAPILTTAVRNPSLSSEAWISYSNLGTDASDNTYTINGLTDVMLTLDRSNNRFVISNINDSHLIPISITVDNPAAGAATSNTVNIPDVNLTAPTLISAQRNPLAPTQAWVTYSNLGTDESTNVYNVEGLPASATVSIDRGLKRFVINNITTGRKTTIAITVSHPTLGTLTSNSVTLPNILGNHS